jgi:hypothetical protein
MNLETKAVIRLIGGPADGFVFTVPAQAIPPFVAVGSTARYSRVSGDGEVNCYFFAPEATH